MGRRSYQSIVVAILFIVMPRSSSAEILGAGGALFTTLIREPVTQIIVELRVRKTGFSDAVLFDNVILNTNDVGSTFTATEGTDIAFPEVVERLTNGVSNSVYVIVRDAKTGRPGAGPIESEREMFHISTVDFSGDSIDSVRLRLNSLELFPNDAGTNVKVHVGLTIVGTKGLVAVRNMSWGQVKNKYAGE